VKVQTGRGAATGTGFVIRAEDDTALVVTNEHVVTPPRQYGPVTRIDVVFHSGRGKAERVVRAELLAADASRDLAFLRVRGVKGVAAPIDLGRKAEVTETSTVYALGFPFGTALSTTRGNPAVTVGKGTVSSLREDEAGEVAVVQIDGDINPGNSGGPVVDGQGRPVGIAVAKITGTRIGLAIPPSELTKMLDGRLGSLTTRVAKSEPGASEVEVVMGLIDPLGKVTRASVRLLPKAPGQPDPSGRPRDRRPIPGAEEVVLKVDPAAQRATGTVTLKGPADKGLTEYWLQPVYTNGARAAIAAGAVPLRVDFSGKAVAARQPPTPQPPPPGPGSAPRNRPGIDPPAAAPAGPPPEPKAAGVTAAPFESGDLKGTRLTAGTGAAPGCACWTADGRGFYHLDGQGTVRRISYPGLREEAALAVGRGCNWLSLSAVGLVATVPQAQEAWVLDPVTLKVGTRIPI